MSHHPDTTAARVTPASWNVEGRPVSVPIHQTSIFAFDDPTELAAAMTGPDGAYAYSGYTNPTVRAYEEAVADLEGGAAALAANSGSAAINAVLTSELRRGDHVIAQRALYGGTFGLLADLADRWGIEVTYIGAEDPAEVRAALRPNSRLLFLETIANPTSVVVDLPALTAVATAAGLVTVVDNTFATPLLCRPIEHGADVVVHSATKYLGGHHDVVGGIAVFADADRYRAAWSQAIRVGATADPFAAWLVLRGMKTLPLRVCRQCENAGVLAERLARHPAVRFVHYPGLPEHPGHALASRLLSGFGGTLAFDVAGGVESAHAVMRSLRLILNAGSLGGTETVVMHPATTSHRHMGADVLRAAGIGPGTIRIAAGTEHADDLWADLEQALKVLS